MSFHELVTVHIAIVLASFILTSYCYSRFRALQNNIFEAKLSGFKYVVVPFYAFGTCWAVLQPIFVPLLKLLPFAWTKCWLLVLTSDRCGWHNGYEPFRQMEADTFIAVSPSRNILFTCEPEAVSQFLRSNTFGKPADLMRILNIFGPTMTGTDNEESRRYRKITTPFFNEKTMKEVWNKSLEAGEAVLDMLQDSTPADDLRSIFAKLSLHLIKSIGFGEDESIVDELQGRSRIPPGHTLSYSQAMHTMLEHFTMIFFIPSVLLKISPLSTHWRAREAYLELRTYLEEFKEKKSVAKEHAKRRNNVTILDLIVEAGKPDDESRPLPLEPAAIIGNIFIFMFAGHEANANTLTFAILLLACHPPIQKLLQQDIDSILDAAVSPHDDWSYERLYPALSESMVGAVVNEVLRLATVLPYLPKSVPEGPVKHINVGDRSHILPANTVVIINTSAIHRHPKHWPQPTGPLESNNQPNVVASFNPQYWRAARGTDTNLAERPTALLRPQLGTFVPFSDGGRGCLGKKFALVELCALVTHIFTKFSVELAIDGLEPDASEIELKTEWLKARANAEYQLSAGVKFDMSLRLTRTVGITFVKRGKERFKDL